MPIALRRGVACGALARTAYILAARAVGIRRGSGRWLLTPAAMRRCVACSSLARIAYALTAPAIRDMENTSK